MEAMEARVKEAEEAVEKAAMWREAAEDAGYARETDAYQTWRDAAKWALAKLGRLLEDALMDGDEAVNKLRKRFGLAPMEEMPWDDVSELVGWDVVIEKEG